MLGYLSAYIICSTKQTVLREQGLRKTVSFEEHNYNVQGQVSKHIFAPNGGFYFYYPSNIFCNAHSF